MGGWHCAVREEAGRAISHVVVRFAVRSGLIAGSGGGKDVGL